MKEEPVRSAKPEQRRWSGQALKVFAFVAVTAAFVAMGLIATTLNEQQGGLGETGRAIFSLAFYAVMGAAVLVGYRLYRRGRRHTALLGDEVVARDPRPPVVYLRSFADEAGVAREEEVVAAILGEAGPFVAIGRPGDALPPLGASRFYIADPDWQGFVADLLRKAAFVLVLAGRTQGLGWEIVQCRRLLDPRRLVILVPRDAASYNGFRESFRAGAGVELPAFGAFEAAPFRTNMLCGAIAFDAAWRPEARLLDRALWRGYRFMYRVRGSGWRPKQARLWLMMHVLGTRAGLALREPGFNWGLVYVILSLSFVAIVLALALLGIIE